MYISRFIFYSVCLFTCTSAYSQMDSLTSLFNNYSANHLQEKVFAHTDKENYFTGEIIWFKLYVSDAHLNRPLSLSSIVYVELLNASHKPVSQEKIVLQNAKGEGSFLLPYSLTSGNYLMRCYTGTMKQASANYFFEKQISIINPLKKPEWLMPVAATYQVSFFPEGGNLVNGIESKIGFKVTDQNGLSLDAKGFIEEEGNQQVVPIETGKFGMGQFLFKPFYGKKYQANIIVGGRQLNVELPKVYPQGVVMRVTENKENQVVIAVESTNPNGSIDLMIHTRQILKTVQRKVLQNGKTLFTIPNNMLGEGISQLTIFDEEQRPLSERLYFKRPANLMQVKLETHAESYGKRQKIDLAINTAFNQKPVAANLSLSAYLIDSLQSIPSSDLLSYLWLESDLVGEIESPQYYFSENPDVSVCMENLLLSQGWRRFKWEDIFNKKALSESTIPEWNGHIIKAKVVKKSTGQLGVGVNVYLSIPAEKPLFYQGISNKEGLVIFNIAPFYGGGQMILQTNGQTDSSYRIDLIDPYAAAQSERHTHPFELHESLAELLKAHSIQSQVGNVYYPEKQQKFLFPEALDTLAFYGKPTHRYFLDDYTRFITMEEVLREYVEGIKLRKNNDGFNLKLANDAYQNFFETEPLVLLDGVPVFNINQLIAFDPLKIKKIEVFNQQFFQNNITFNGILNCQTYQGDLAGYSLDANALAIAYDGLQLKREFFHPTYEGLEKQKDRLPDFRNVLSWIPDLSVSEKGVQKVSFFSSDITGKYIVIVQGVSSNGVVGRDALYLEVK